MLIINRLISRHLSIPSISYSKSIMRIGSSKSDTPDYQNENNELKKLHQERLKRQHQQNQSQMTPQSQSPFLTKQLKTSKPYTADKYPHNLFLNSILSDQRNIKDKPNSIALSSLFQDDPRTFSPGISKNIKGILMTTYGFVMDVLGTIAESGVPFVLVNDSSENGSGRVERNCAGYKNMSLVFPPRMKKGYGVFHTKLWLIKFPTFLRVVIGTGNQHAEDWLVWLNAYWYQDFSLKGMKISDYEEKTEKAGELSKQKVEEKAEKQQASLKVSKKQQKGNQPKSSVISLDDSDEEILVYASEKKSSIESIKQSKKQFKLGVRPQKKPFNYEQDFKQTLNQVLKNMFPAGFSLQKQTGIDLEKYDFSNVQVVLIPSIAGWYKEKDGEMEKYGMAKLKSVMKEIGPRIKKGTLAYNTSSLGVVEPNFLKQLYFSFLPYAESFSPSNYKVIYPSQKYINEKTCGEASVLFLKKENYYKSELKKEVFYHYEPSERNYVKGAIPHLKTVVIENQDPQSEDERNECVFFMGSHNMTKAAWGSYDKGNLIDILGETQISFSNSELGLLFLKMDKEKLLNFLPYKYPPRKYNDYDKPFIREL